MKLLLSNVSKSSSEKLKLNIKQERQCLTTFLINEKRVKNTTSSGAFLTFMLFLIWLAPYAGKMNQIRRFDWLPERVRWRYLARSGLPAVSRKKCLQRPHNT